MSSGPFLIDKAFVLEPRDDQPARLVVDLVPTDEKTFLAKLKEAKPARSRARRSAPLPDRPSAPADAKPVVVLDPGHGGVDPGTSSATGITEKEVVLAFARSLKTKLEATSHYEVYLTREDDTFLPLRERVEFAAEEGREPVPVDTRRLLPQADRQSRRAQPSTRCRSRPPTRRRKSSRPRRISPTPSPASRCRAI